MSTARQPADALHLWYLGHPARPALIGDIRLVLTGTRGVSLRYSPAWLANGYALSEDLPLLDMEHLPADRDSAAGAVDDARPDRWGERVIRHVLRPSRLSLLEMLYFAGDARFGALGVSTSRESYQPYVSGPLPQLGEVEQVHELVRKVLAGDRVPEAARRLIAPGATMGGARPKALLEIDGEQWVLKFDEDADSSEPLVEHAAMTLAARAGITVAQTRPIALARGAAVAVRRFDRIPDGRLHALSAKVALRAAGAELSYPELAQLLRRRGPTAGGRNRAQMRELFRRLVFNILIDNTDDHEQNHALLMNVAQQYELSPAFDVLPSGQALGYQAMVVGQAGAESSIANALSACRSYWLSPQEAADEARQVARVVDGWRVHFERSGVPKQAVRRYADQIDRPALAGQRKRFAG